MIGGYTAPQRQPHRPRRAAARLLRGRAAALRGQGRHRLHPRDAARPRASGSRRCAATTRRSPTRRARATRPGCEPRLVAQIGFTRVDARRAPAPSAVPRPARRQGRRGGGARVTDEVKAGRRSIPISHADRRRVPARRGVTSSTSRATTRRSAPVMVPHVRDRPLALQSFPHGIEGGGFFSRTRRSTSPTGSPARVPKREGGEVRPGARQRRGDARLPRGPERDHAAHLDQPRRPARAARPARSSTSTRRPTTSPRSAPRPARSATCCASSGSSRSR